ncbi:MAG: Fe-S protein assembly co-chaperone HscB [Saprospiraceae bacterium]|nr:Fe-S protein assembly co-chaperone HscB [Saprospiraceae bacterium]
MDYFQYFNLNPTFQIDLNELRKRYYQKSKELHPDFSANNIIEDADYLTALNNQAYQVLQDPVARLKYLIESIKGPIPDQHQILPQDFLMEMLELHESIYESKENLNHSELEKHKVQLEAYEKQALQTIEDAIHEFDNGNRSDSILNEMTFYYFKLKYFRRLRQTLTGSSIEM